MYGIYGKVYYDHRNEVQAKVLPSMIDTIAHRRPDSEGRYVEGSVGLGHRRLAIIDLNTGAQPMCNEDKKVWVVFNGKVYNFQQLTQELKQKSHTFSSATDTEAIIHA